jgi:hypothetical protein
LCLAVEVFPEMTKILLPAAVNIGELTWKEGLQISGNSIDDGISGNAIALHSLCRCFEKITRGCKTETQKNVY